MFGMAHNTVFREDRSEEHLSAFPVLSLVYRLSFFTVSPRSGIEAREASEGSCSFLTTFTKKRTTLRLNDTSNLRIHTNWTGFPFLVIDAVHVLIPAGII